MQNISLPEPWRRPWGSTAVRINSYLFFSSVTHRVLLSVIYVKLLGKITTNLFSETADEISTNENAYNPNLWIPNCWWKIPNYSRQCSHNPTNYPSLLGWLKRGKKWGQKGAKCGVKKGGEMMTKGARKGGRRQKGGEIMTKGVRMWQFKYDCHLLWHLSVTIHLHQDDLAFENSCLVLSFFPKYWWVAATNQRAVKAD